QNWEYLHPLAQGTWNGQLTSNPVPSGEMWECPDFFPVGTKHVLIYSTEHHVYWHVGTFDKKELRFHSERKGLLDYGAYYAPKSMLDGKNRQILWGWVQETRPREESRAAGWGGAFSLPRVLTLASDNELQMEVIPEFASLRTGTVSIQGPLSSEKLDSALSKAVFPNRAGEVTCKFMPQQSRECRLELRLLSGANPTPLLTMKFGDGDGKGFSVAVGNQTLPLSPDRHGVSTIQIWIDGSVMETFIDRTQVITTRSYAGPTESGNIQVVWSGEGKGVKG